MKPRLVVVGGDAAGMSAASQARRRVGADQLDILAFERGNFTSYSACGIPYWIGGSVTERDRLIARTPEVFRNDYSIDVRIRTEVVEIDPEQRNVLVRDETGIETRESFDDLVVSTGAIPIKPDISGIDAEGIFGVQTLDDGCIVNQALSLVPRCAVVVGGGYIGIEMAEALKNRGLDVTIVERLDHPMNTLDADMGALVADAIRQLDIELRTNEEVKAFETDGNRVRAVVTNAGPIDADIVVLGLGVRPNSDLAAAAGIEVGTSGAIAVDDHMRTSIDGIWSAGDCAEKRHRLTGEKVSIPLGTHANKEGRTIGINVTGGEASFPGVIGTAVSKVCEIEVARTGLKESDAPEAGFEIATGTIESTTRAGYFPGAQPITVKLIADKASGRLLGAQIVGKEGAAKRIDVLAMAIWNEMTVDEVVNVDLSYAPPFSPVWDPVLIAARKTYKEIVEARNV